MSSKNKKSSTHIILLVGLVLVILGALIAKKEGSVEPTTGQPIAAATAPTESPAPAPTTNEQATATPATPAATTTEATTTAPAATPVATPVMEAEGRSIGKKDAPIQIKEYASLTCGHCAHFHNEVLNELRVKYIDTGKVRIEFHEFPLNKPALDATKLLNCLPESQYYGFMTMLFQTQERWAFSSDYVASLRQSGKLAGLSEEKIDSCLNDKAAEEKIVATMQDDAKKYGIDSTPTFIINDGAAKIRGAVPVSEFAKVLDPMLEGKIPPQQGEDAMTPVPQAPAATATETPAQPTPATEQK